MGKECKECGSTEFYTEIKNIHIGEYCLYCNKWQSWIKQDKNSGKTKDDYKREYLETQAPTDAQINYLRDRWGYDDEVKSKWHAISLINSFKK